MNETFPLQAPVCEHAFCSGCIREWLIRQATCPVDRQGVTGSQLKAAPRILRNLLSRLTIECDNAASGCEVIVKLDLLPSHCCECEFNPKKPVECGECGLTVAKDELKDHSCIRDLRTVIARNEKKMNEMECVVRALRKDMDVFREVMNAVRSAVPSTSAIPVLGSAIPVLGSAIVDSAIVESASSFEMDDVDRWVGTMPRARVTRWGGMISTPDTSLQESVRKALLDSNCPLQVVNELMENSHERRWPPGLSTLEIRQLNRRLYDNYVCRKIPGRQAVVVMASDNGHIAEDMLLDPGLVMIFAHGIE